MLLEKNSSLPCVEFNLSRTSVPKLFDVQFYLLTILVTCISFYLSLFSTSMYSMTLISVSLCAIVLHLQESAVYCV